MIGRLFLSHSLDGTVDTVSNSVSTLVVAVVYIRSALFGGHGCLSCLTACKNFCFL